MPATTSSRDLSRSTQRTILPLIGKCSNIRLNFTYVRLSVCLPIRTPAAPLLAFRNSCNTGDGQLIEEQTLPFYHEKRYCSVRTGDSLRDRYRVIAKVGYGGYTTVWPVRDERFEH